MNAMYIGYYFNAKGEKVPCMFHALPNSIRKIGNYLYTCRPSSIQHLGYANNNIQLRDIVCFFELFNPNKYLKKGEQQ